MINIYSLGVRSVHTSRIQNHALWNATPRVKYLHHQMDEAQLWLRGKSCFRASNFVMSDKYPYRYA